MKHIPLSNTCENNCFPTSFGKYHRESWSVTLLDSGGHDMRWN